MTIHRKVISLQSASLGSDIKVTPHLFQISHNKYAAISDLEVADREAIWSEMTKVCGDLLGDISRDLKENADWQIELLDPARRPVFRIRLVAETLE